VAQGRAADEAVVTIIEWDQPSYLNTLVGQLLVNQPIAGLGSFMAVPSKCSVRRSLRVTSDSIPQGDGQILHRRFSNGIELTLVLELWKTVDPDPALGEPACGTDLRLMLEHLGLYLQAVLNGAGQWYWQPSGVSGFRMLDAVRWLVDVSRELDSRRTTVTFTIDSPFPCFQDALQQSGSDTLIGDGGSAILTNAGNHEAYPIIEVLSGTAAFTIINNSLVDQNGDPVQIRYDGTGIVAPDFAEIDVFRNTIYLNGNEANLKAGIDAEETDFFVLRPGDNDVEISGADAEFRFFNSYVPV
jgi:hypothetical protein